MLDGKLLRPTQDCTERSGRRISINQISKLSPNEFKESEFALLNPSPASEYPDGMHTFCVTENGIIVDGKSECFIWQAFARKINKVIK